MAKINLKNVKIKGIKTVIPKDYIDIDDEIEFFENNPKKLARAKKMVGYGRRYIADENTTVVDMAVYAAEKLFSEMNFDRNKIDLLIFVNQKPDYPEPCDACISHGILGLSKNCTTLDINLGCSGYIHALLTAYTYLTTGSYKNCLLLAGDLCGRANDQSNRKAAPVFGDAASATILEYTEENNEAYFITGTDGTGWDKIVHPLGGSRLPIDNQNINLKIKNPLGEDVILSKGLMKGEDVFNFTMDVAPQLLRDIMSFAKWQQEDVDMFALHQANKQIVESIILKSQIPQEKTPIETFSKYANNSTNSVVTVLCDQGYGKNLKKVVLCAFGVGLSWGAAAIDVSDMYNGGIATYAEPKNKLTKEELLNRWIKYYEE